MVFRTFWIWSAPLRRWFQWSDRSDFSGSAIGSWDLRLKEVGVLSRDLRKQVHQSCLPYLRLAGHSSLFRFPSDDVISGFPRKGTFYNILWVTIQFCLVWFSAVCTQNLLRGDFLFEAFVTKERFEQILLITEFAGKGLLPEDASLFINCTLALSPTG